MAPSLKLLMYHLDRDVLLVEVWLHSGFTLAEDVQRQ
jgi:hypothetical protein